ncbi:MAG TPA: IS3 family transposase, partial [Herpetosiphonaceae bacterium]|nr:IS3 family transposase [Herpetosiphonaceae bacterium]
TWRARSSATSADQGSAPRADPRALDGHRSINSMVETFFKTLKSELVWRTVFRTRAEARDALARYIDGFYNPLRRHSALGFISPAQFERQAASQIALH